MHHLYSSNSEKWNVAFTQSLNFTNMVQSDELKIFPLIQNVFFYSYNVYLSEQCFVPNVQTSKTFKLTITYHEILKQFAVSLRSKCDIQTLVNFQRFLHILFIYY